MYCVTRQWVRKATAVVYMNQMTLIPMEELLGLEGPKWTSINEVST